MSVTRGLVKSCQKRTLIGPDKLAAMSDNPDSLLSLGNDSKQSFIHAVP